MLRKLPSHMNAETDVFLSCTVSASTLQFKPVSKYIDKTEWDQATTYILKQKYTYASNGSASRPRFNPTVPQLHG
jgi:hypothetical protein